MIEKEASASHVRATTRSIVHNVGLIGQRVSGFVIMAAHRPIGKASNCEGVSWGMTLLFCTVQLIVMSAL